MTSGMTAYLGIILGAAGIVFGVIALMVSAEVTRRVTNIINNRFQQAELELMKGLDAQDRELKRQRRVLSEALEGIELGTRTLSQGLDGLRERIATVEGFMDDRRNVRRRAVPTDEERGFTRKRGDAGKFETTSPFAD